jgi:phosphate transport system protein
MIMKINNDLERVGDHAVNIAGRSLSLMDLPNTELSSHISAIAEESIGMLRDSLKAFTYEKPGLAMRVKERDDTVDGLRDQVTRQLMTHVANDPSAIEEVLSLILVARDLERIADLATNIAEDVVFMVKGEVLKHSPPWDLDDPLD